MRRIEETYYNPIDQEPDVAVGIALPFSNGTAIFALNYTTEQQAVSNLKNLLLTRKGERYMQPLFGSDIWDSLFEQNVDELAETLRSTVRSDIAYWTPYIVIDDIIIEQRINGEPGPYGHGIRITLKFHVESSAMGRTITLTVSPTGTVNLQG